MIFIMVCVGCLWNLQMLKIFRPPFRRLEFYLPKPLTSNVRTLNAQGLNVMAKCRTLSLPACTLTVSVLSYLIKRMNAFIFLYLSRTLQLFDCSCIAILQNNLVFEVISRKIFLAGIVLWVYLH